MQAMKAPSVGYSHVHKLSIILFTCDWDKLNWSYLLLILMSRNVVSKLIRHGSNVSSLWYGMASFSLCLHSLITSSLDTWFKYIIFLQTTDLLSDIATLVINLISFPGAFSSFFTKPGYWLKTFLLRLRNSFAKYFSTRLVFVLYGTDQHSRIFVFQLLNTFSVESDDNSCSISPYASQIFKSAARIFVLGQQ